MDLKCLPTSFIDNHCAGDSSASQIVVIAQLTEAVDADAQNRHVSSGTEFQEAHIVGILADGLQPDAVVEIVLRG